MTDSQKILLAAGIFAAALFRVVPSIAEDAPGAKPGDDAMSCEQIGAELAPYAQQMMGDAAALADTDQQLVDRGQKRVADTAPTVAAMSAAATAASLDPTGMASKAYGQTEAATQQALWKRAEAEDKPLADKAKQQTNQVVAKGAALQSNARIQRLMQLAQQKDCH